MTQGARSSRTPSRWLVAGGVLVLIAGVALALWRESPAPRGSVVATIALTGGSCRTHSAACAKLSDGGVLVIFGPEHAGAASFPQHRIRLHGARTPVDVKLPPGDYNLGFFIEPPWGVLWPDFGVSPTEGLVHVGTHVVHLGLVRPSRDWVITGD